jgi:hypothetical protein
MGAGGGVINADRLELLAREQRGLPASVGKRVMNLRATATKRRQWQGG